MIYFGITLRARAVSADWRNTEKIFNRTLASVYNQTCPEFKVLVACHETPELEEIYDDRVEFLTTDIPYPTNRYEMRCDKGYKCHMLAQRIREMGGGYTMMVDSDDLISNKVAEYMKENPGKPGFLSKYGYLYKEGSSYMKKCYRLDRTCGSCLIVNYSMDDLPEHLPESVLDTDDNQRWLFRKSHRKLPGLLASIGRDLEFLPFISTIYVQKTGDNLSTMEGNDISWKRKLELCIRKKVQIEPEIEKEFGLTSP